MLETIEINPLNNVLEVKMIRHNEHTLVTSTGAETITARIGAAALPLGIIMFVVSTAIFHPSREDPMDNPAVFMEYAHSDNWIAVHFVQWVATLLLIGGLIALYHAISSKSEASTGVARFGLAAAVVTVTAFTMLQAIDGVALKWAVDHWAQAPTDQQPAAFAAALSLRWSEYSLQSFSNIMLGLTLIIYALAMEMGRNYARWLGWLAAGAGLPRLPAPLLA
jgi:hypothetical protein